MLSYLGVKNQSEFQSDRRQAECQRAARSRTSPARTTGRRMRDTVASGRFTRRHGPTRVAASLGQQDQPYPDLILPCRSPAARTVAVGQPDIACRQRHVRRTLETAETRLGPE